MRRCYTTPKFTLNDVITLLINEKSSYPCQRNFLLWECEIWKEIKKDHMVTSLKKWGHCK
jgi:hypothetical protein